MRTNYFIKHGLPWSLFGTSIKHMSWKYFSSASRSENAMAHSNFVVFQSQGEIFLEKHAARARYCRYDWCYRKSGNLPRLNLVVSPILGRVSICQVHHSIPSTVLIEDVQLTNWDVLTKTKKHTGDSQPSQTAAFRKSREFLFTINSTPPRTNSKSTWK